MKDFTVTAHWKGTLCRSMSVSALSAEDAIEYAKKRTLLDRRCKYDWACTEVEQEAMEWEPESQEVQDDIMRRERGIRSII